MEAFRYGFDLHLQIQKMNTVKPKANRTRSRVRKARLPKKVQQPPRQVPKMVVLPPSNFSRNMNNIYNNLVMESNN
jgi:hypothetical protein